MRRSRPPFRPSSLVARLVSPRFKAGGQGSQGPILIARVVDRRDGWFLVAGSCLSCLVLSLCMGAEANWKRSVHGRLYEVKWNEVRMAT